MDKAEWDSLLRVTTDLTHEFENVRMKFDDNACSEGESISQSESNHHYVNHNSSGDVEKPQQ